MVEGSITIRRNTRKLFSATALWLKSDRALLFFFLTSLIFASISVLFVPLTTLEEITEYTSPERQSLNIVAHVKRKSTLAEQSFSSRDSQEKGENRTIGVNLNGRNSDNEGNFFLTHSSPYHTIFSPGTLSINGQPSPPAQGSDTVNE